MTLKDCIVNTFHIDNNGNPTGVVVSARFNLETGSISSSHGLNLTTFTPEDNKRQPTLISPRTDSWADFAEVTHAYGVETILFDRGRLHIAYLNEGPFKISLRQKSLVHEITGFNISK